MLLGRASPQVAHGGTLPSSSLTLASTTHSTKGKVYLGNAQQTVYDEVNERIGVNEPSPDARMHLKHTTGGGTQTVTPITATWQGGWGVSGGGGDFSVATQTNDGGTSFIQGSDTTDANGCKIAITQPTNPLIFTGWTFHVVARKRSGDAGDHPVIGIQVRLMEHGSYSTPGVGGGTFGGASSTIAGFYIGTFGGNALSTSFVDYSFALTSAEATDMLTPLTYLVFQVETETVNGDLGTTDTFPEITQVYVSGPGVLNATPFQQWENLTVSNTLNYAIDGAGATTLELDGVPKFRVGTDGMEIAIGSPANGKLLRATDTDGTVQWRTILAGYPSFGFDSFGQSDAAVITKPGTSGVMVVRAAPVSLTGQTASIGSTTLLTPTALGTFMVVAYMTCTTSGDAGDSVVVNLSWNDGTAAQTTPLATCNLEAVGNKASGSFAFISTSSAISYSTTLTSPGAGTPAHTLYLRILVL